MGITVTVQTSFEFIFEELRIRKLIKLVNHVRQFRECKFC
jgi:hypothetical protein